MENILDFMSYLIKPASSSCNLRCPYCFYIDVADNRCIPNFGKMSNETIDSLVSGAFTAIRNGGQVQFSFQGGEPTLAGLQYFKTFTEIVRKYLETKPDVKVNYAIQTNGTMLNDEWIDFFSQYNFLVGVSLDGYQENTDQFRIDIRGIGQYHLIMKNIEKIRSRGIDFNILTVLTKNLAKDPEKLYRFYKEHNIKHVQLIPCLPKLDLKEDTEAMDARSFASFYKPFYDLWKEDYLRGEGMSVGLFDNVIPMYVGIAPQQCGMLGKCAPQFVVEGDGSVYPCDFFVLDEYRCGSVQEHSVHDLLRKSTMIKFLKEGNRPSPSCATCPFKQVCHGNCKRQNVVLFDDTGYCGYQDFLDHSYESMIQIAQNVFKVKGVNAI